MVERESGLKFGLNLSDSCRSLHPKPLPVINKLNSWCFYCDEQYASNAFDILSKKDIVYQYI